MALIAQHKKFKANLLGYVDIGFDDFRSRVLPLCSRRAKWTAAQNEYIGGLVSQGAGYSLQQLFGLGHKPAAAVIGRARLSPEPMAKEELVDFLIMFLAKCHRLENWGAQQYIDLVGYLGDGLGDIPSAPAEIGVEQLAEMYRAAGPAFKRIVLVRLTGAASAALDTVIEADSVEARTKRYVEENSESAMEYMKTHM